MADWEAIYQEHSAGILQYLMMLTRNREEAEDLLQETFMRAMQSRSFVNDISKIRSWMMTIARNLFLDTVRKRRKREKLHVDSEDFDILEAVPDPAPAPDTLVAAGDFKIRLESVLNTMGENYRTAFMLGIVQQYSYKEIGDITGWSESMVKSNIFRARKKVASEMAEFRR
ncbi:RNA polymerase sigma factor [bacterium]|nr:RNA polymerase sigma factor [bacterium]